MPVQLDVCLLISSAALQAALQALQAFVSWLKPKFCCQYKPILLVE
jgi:hypothetical protein